MKILLCGALLLWTMHGIVVGEDLTSLAEDFWKWRAIHQPLSGDDIPRIERPAEWIPVWSAASVADRRNALSGFEKRWNAMDPSQLPIPQQVDYRLIGSALARVRWELDISRSWQRNPRFYVDQTLGSIFDRLLQPPPFDSIRSKQIIDRMRNIPPALEDAKKNLDSAVRPFTQLTLSGLQDIRGSLNQLENELTPLLAAEQSKQLPAAVHDAIVALESYRDWLNRNKEKMPVATAIGPENYAFFLKNVALLPYTASDLLRMGQQEWQRAVSFETYERNRNTKLPVLPIFPDQIAQLERSRGDEQSIRKFLQEKDILTVPEWVKHYVNLPLPAYLNILRALGVTDDLTSPTRLKENGVSYIPEPAPSLPYFYLASARDPRPLMVHEGIPGHYLQLVLSWAHEDPIRRHYYDSGPNEGIAFYAEEMMLQAGLFDDSPRTREIIYNFMRLRALRVEVDVKLATGEFTIEQAADYLEKTVPMDQETALEEAASFASAPGQAITYQIGKLQILEFLAEARRKKGKDFSLRHFHDFVWENGNVPIALQQWEYLNE